MTDRIEDTLREAMRLAGDEIGPALPTAARRAELLAGVAQRRLRRQRRAVGSLATVAVLVCAGAIVGPKLLGGSGAQKVQVATAAPPSVAGQTHAASGAGSVTLTPTSETPGAAFRATISGAVNQGATGSKGVAGQSGSAGSIPAAPSSSAGSQGISNNLGSVAGPLIMAPQAAATSTSTKPVRVSSIDDGKTIELRVGQTLSVTLSGSVSLAWTKPTSSTTTVMVLESGSTDATTGGTHATFRAVSAGRATIGAIQAPGRPWRITVAVKS